MNENQIEEPASPEVEKMRTALKEVEKLADVLKENFPAFVIAVDCGAFGWLDGKGNLGQRLQLLHSLECYFKRS
jgi:hypothetical protein